MGPEALAQVLRPLQNMFPAEQYPDLLVGLAVSDDAAVYRISDEVAVIQTLDFFPPVVDDPYDYGAIAAANAMSDVYAMGGEVVLALNISAFPPDLPPDDPGRDPARRRGKGRRGGRRAGRRAHRRRQGAQVRPVGDGPDPPRPRADQGRRAAGRRAGPDQAAGRGHHHHRAQGRRGRPGARGGGGREHEAPQPPGRAADPARPVAALHACTDITGFALLGHGYEMAEKSGVRLRFHLRQAALSGRARSSTPTSGSFRPARATTSAPTSTASPLTPGIAEEMQQLLYTPETSGGLLVAVAAGRGRRR